MEVKPPVFDATGWYGPFLLLKVKCFLDRLAPGESALVTGQKESPSLEMRALLRATGFELMECRPGKRGHDLLIRRQVDFMPMDPE